MVLTRAPYSAQVIAVGAPWLFKAGRSAKAATVAWKAAHTVAALTGWSVGIVDIDMLSLTVVPLVFFL
ncbi:hypothetical protein MINTM021_11440 [Mycobacterium paraintracellulare]|nr:hypothetical protein MINTM021_11440 [Mycobacterium paraintracellulare]